jgi:hypothetical protein
MFGYFFLFICLSSPVQTNNQHSELEISKFVDHLKREFFEKSLNFSIFLNRSSFSNYDDPTAQLNNEEKQTIETHLRTFQLDLLKKRNFICLHDLHDEFDWEHIKLENLSSKFNEYPLFGQSNSSLSTILNNKVKKKQSYLFCIFFPNSNTKQSILNQSVLIQ